MKTNPIEVGELVAAHVCDAADHPMNGDAHAGHAGHGAAGGSSPHPNADVPVFLYSPMGEMRNFPGAPPTAASVAAGASA